MAAASEEPFFNNKAQLLNQDSSSSQKKVAPFPMFYGEATSSGSHVLGKSSALDTSNRDIENVLDEQKELDIEQRMIIDEALTQ